MKFSLKRKALSLILVGVMAALPVTMTGCTSAQWVSTLDSIISVAGPALVNILSIVEISQGQPINTALVAKINQDANTVKVLASDFAAASAAAAPTACAQLNAAIAVYSQDQAQVMALVQVSNSATQTKVATLSLLVTGTVASILSLIPQCKTAAAMRASLSAQAVPLPLKTFVQSYNRVLVVPTGNKAVDAFTKSHKIHAHSKFVRMISLGFAQ